MGKKDKKASEREMPFLDHLEELRWRLLKSIIAVVIFSFVSLPLSGRILDLLTLPNQHLNPPPKLIFLKPTGMLMVRLNVAIAAGIVLSLPVVFYQFWKFISPGLLEKERRYVFPIVVMSTACFLLGVAFAYFVMIPFILPFLYGLGTETIEPTINISNYIGFVTRIILVSGVIFELPVLSLFLTRVGILTPAFLRKYRKYAIVLAFVLAAILTPPDPLSQLLLAVPLILLFEISIWISVIAAGKRKKGS